MNTLWNIFRKPFVWKPLFVLSVIGINLATGSGWADLALWTSFSVVIITIIASPYGQPSVNKKNFLERRAEKRRLVYGSRNIHSFAARKDILGY